MNETPYAGYWFYGMANAEQRASFYASYGLIADAPTLIPTLGIGSSIMSGLFGSILGG